MMKVSRKEEEEWDAPLIALAQKSKGDVRLLLHAFFSFLSRRTDFYVIQPKKEEASTPARPPAAMGFREGDAEKMVLASFRTFPLRRMPSSSPRPSQVTPSPLPSITTTTTTTAAAARGTAVAATGGADGPKKKNKEHEEEQRKSNVEDLSGGKKEGKDDLSDPMANVRLTEEGLQVPVGNGGSTKGYHWTQTISEVSVALPVPPGTRGKDLQVTLKPSSISVLLKRHPPPPSPLIQGDLSAIIRTDESTWSLEGGVLLLTLDKTVKTWWGSVFKGDDRIDTTLVDSTRKITEYDDATQGMLRKILFDQRQERLGLPSSDDILGKSSKTPPLPSGVEYIDKSTLDEHNKNNNNKT